MYRFLEKSSRAAMKVAGWCYLTITLLICFDIVCRRLLGFSTEATTEVTGYLMAIGMSWGLAGTLFERGHVRIDVLVQKLPVRIRVWLHLASLSALLVATAFFSWGAFSLFKDSYDFDAKDLSSLHMPMAIPEGLWALGFVLLLLAVLAVGARALHQIGNGDLVATDRMLMAMTYEDEAAETLEALGQVPSETERAGAENTHSLALGVAK